MIFTILTVEVGRGRAPKPSSVRWGGRDAESMRLLLASISAEDLEGEGHAVKNTAPVAPSSSTTIHGLHGLENEVEEAEKKYDKWV